VLFLLVFFHPLAPSVSERRGEKNKKWKMFQIRSSLVTLFLFSSFRKFPLLPSFHSPLSAPRQMRGAAPSSSTGQTCCCSSSGRGTAVARSLTRATTSSSTTRSATKNSMLRAVAAAVARSASRASGRDRVSGVVFDRQLVGGSISSTSSSLFRSQLRSVASAAASATETDVAATTASTPTTPPTPSFRAAIDFRALKASLPLAVANARDRRAVSADPELVARLYDEWRELQDELEKVRAERNDNAKAMKVCFLVFFPLRLINRSALSWCRVPLDRESGCVRRWRRRRKSASFSLVFFLRRLSCFLLCFL